MHMPKALSLRLSLALLQALKMMSMSLLQIPHTHVRKKFRNS